MVQSPRVAVVTCGMIGSLVTSISVNMALLGVEEQEKSILGIGTLMKAQERASLRPQGMRTTILIRVAASGTRLRDAETRPIRCLHHHCNRVAHCSSAWCSPVTNLFSKSRDGGDTNAHISHIAASTGWDRERAARTARMPLLWPSCTGHGGLPAAPTERTGPSSCRLPQPSAGR